jgi:hypothetical protein
MGKIVRHCGHSPLESADSQTNASAMRLPLFLVLLCTLAAVVNLTVLSVRASRDVAVRLTALLQSSRQLADAPLIWLVNTHGL